MGGVIRLRVRDYECRRRAAIEAAWTNVATCRDLHCCGQATTIVAVGASATGSQTRSLCRRVRTDSGTTATMRPRARRCGLGR